MMLQHLKKILQRVISRKKVKRDPVSQKPAKNADGPTCFPGIMWLMPAPQWYCTKPEKLHGGVIASLYRKDIPEYVPAEQRMWALEQSSLFALLDKVGGWQAYLLPMYEVHDRIANESIMDVLIELREHPVAQRYWQSLARRANVDMALILSFSDPETLAEQYPSLWKEHIEGLQWIERFFARHYRKPEEKRVALNAA